MDLYIKETAKRYGISLTQLAERLGVNRQTVYFYIEQGAKNPLSQLEKIANAIGCPIEELYRGEMKEEEFSYTKHLCPYCGKMLNITIE